MANVAPRWKVLWKGKVVQTIRMQRALASDTFHGREWPGGVIETSHGVVEAVNSKSRCVLRLGPFSASRGGNRG